MANDRMTSIPIQRNKLDVATELTMLHVNNFSFLNLDADNIKRIFAEYYSLVVQLEKTADKNPNKLMEFLPDEIKMNLF
ncbi:MAG: hypothetical protein GX893_01465 [Firmicutes bacterium]|nr:hypothetical protein [Bacillota bacterium]